MTPCDTPIIEIWIYKDLYMKDLYMNYKRFDAFLESEALNSFQQM